jgi:CRISPR-associated protein (TIGR02710 family)
MSEFEVVVGTMGTGGDTERPFLMAVDDFSPRLVVCIFSSTSEEMFGKKIATGVQERGASFRAEKVSTHENLDAITVECMKILENLMDEGIDPEKVMVNYTGGTKAMAAGLSMAAISLGCLNFYYVSGERHKITGKVESGKERGEGVEIWKIRERMTRDNATLLAKNRHYQAAAMELSPLIKAQAADQETVALANSLEVLSKWDNFDHVGARECLRNRNKPLIPAFADGRETLLSSLGRLVDEAKSPARSGPHLAHDLVLNAGRRIEQGRYDDGVARLYRALEMMLQFKIHERFGIRTDNVSDACEAMNEEEKALVRTWMTDGKPAKIELDRDIKLLSIGDELIRTAMASEEKRNIMDARNHSILAHGSNKIRPEVAERFLIYITGLGAQLFEGWGKGDEYLVDLPRVD